MRTLRRELGRFVDLAFGLLALYLALKLVQSLL